MLPLLRFRFESQIRSRCALRRGWSSLSNRTWPIPAVPDRCCLNGSSRRSSQAARSLVSIRYPRARSRSRALERLRETVKVNIFRARHQPDRTDSVRSVEIACRGPSAQSFVSFFLAHASPQDQPFTRFVTRGTRRADIQHNAMPSGNRRHRNVREPSLRKRRTSLFRMESALCLNTYVLAPAADPNHRLTLSTDRVGVSGACSLLSLPL